MKGKGEACFSFPGTNNFGRAEGYGKTSEMQKKSLFFLVVYSFMVTFVKVLNFKLFMRKILFWVVVTFAALALAIIVDRCAGKQSAGPANDGRENFVVITDVVPDAILEIRYFSTYNFVGSRIDGYEEPVALLTREAADSLRAVSDDVKQLGYRLKIYDAYRPQKAVDHFVRWAANMTDTLMKPYFYPDLDKHVLFPQGYIAEKSGHTRGSTIDLTLFDMKTEKELDMGGTFDFFGLQSHPSFGGNPDTQQYVPTDGITAEQFANRMTLRQAMMRHGFKPLDEEWWHFTLRNEPFPDTYFTFPVKSF